MLIYSIAGNCEAVCEGVSQGLKSVCVCVKGVSRLVI